MRSAFLLPLLPVVLFSCKPKENAGPDAKVIAGTYIGTTNSRYRVDAGSSGLHEGSAVRPDTVIITAISADSFQVTSLRWVYGAPSLHYDGTDSFFNRRGTTSFNDNMQEITVRFNKATNSVMINRHHVMMSSWFTQNWEDFTGVKQ